MTATFFANQSDFRNWLEKNHKKETELLVGFYFVHGRRPHLPSDSKSQFCAWRTSPRRNDTYLHQPV